jgi:predicted chitinase
LGETALIRQGGHLYSQLTGLPWSPDGFVATAPDGTRYTLDATGKITGVAFMDGTEWMVSDAGVVLVGGTLSDRVDFLRDTQGRIVQIAGNRGGTSQTIVYRYGTTGTLDAVRVLQADGPGTSYGYDGNGPWSDHITANLGTAANWLGNPNANSWSGNIAPEGSVVAFTVRDSELASTVKIPGVGGTLLLAVSVAFSDASSTISWQGCQVVGESMVGGIHTYILRIDSAGLKLIRVTGAGSVDMRVAALGDLNADGRVDGLDSQAWEDAAVAADGHGDLNGDGLVNSADRQILYANYGWRANLPPSQTSQATTMTHADLPVAIPLDQAATDSEGDRIFWQITSATHGTAKLSADGRSIEFVPDAGYTGPATVTVVADDGFARSAPIQLQVAVSSARLTGIHVDSVPDITTGGTSTLHVTADFEDQLGVDISDAAGYLTWSLVDLHPMGGVDDTHVMVGNDGRTIIRNGGGPAVLTGSRTAPDGNVVRVVIALNDAATDEAAADLLVVPDVYPNTLSLLPDGTRQLKVKLVDPNTGEATDIAAAHPSSSSGTRYFSSDESVATVDANGMITAHRSGTVVISVVYLGSYLDNDGSIIVQRVGLANVTLHVEAAQITDDDDATSAPRQIIVSATDGGIVSSTSGETVLVGAGALVADTGVSIRRLPVDELANPPGTGVLVPVGRFTLDLGAAVSQYPLQLAIPVQGGITASPGDQVLFLRKGTVMAADGTLHDTWWLVDNGFVGADGIARTASPPYSGLNSSGEYMVARVVPGTLSGNFSLTLNAGDWVTFSGMGVSLSGGLTGMGITSDIIGILATSATGLSVGGYHFGVPKFADVTLPQIGPNDTYQINISTALPNFSLPYASAVYPQIAAASVEAGTLKFTVNNASPGEFTGELVLRAIFADGSHRDVKTYPGNTQGDITIDPLPGVAVGNVSWQLVRRISTSLVAASGELSRGDYIEFAGSVVTISPKYDMAAVLTRTGVQFVRQDKVEGETALVDLYGAPNDFDGTYLTGNKVQAVAFSGDVTRCYVAGNGVIYVIDTITFKLISTIPVHPGRNIASITSFGNMLIVGEGQSYGSGASGNQLYIININPTDPAYNLPVALQGTGIESSTFGVTGITIGPDGKTMVVGVPLNPNSVMLGDTSKRGDVLIFDLSTLDFTTGTIAPPVIASLPSDGISGKAPQIITATKDPDRYLVSDVADYNRGLSTLVITRDTHGKVISATMASIDLSQPANDIVRDRLDIQRVQSAVLVTIDGVDYAIVGDDNYNFNDPYWKAMFEAPDFVYSPFGPPIPVGGSASAKKVAVGGKLGIVKDPFGKLGTPAYLGATLPLDGYGIVNLSVSEDGKVLLGQLKGGFGTIDQNTQNPNQNVTWSVNALIAAAIAMADDQRTSVHLALPSDAQQVIPPPGGTTVGAPIGTAFDPTPVVIDPAAGNMGDVIRIDVKEMAARKLLGLPDMPGVLSDANKARVAAVIGQMTDFVISVDDFHTLTGTQSASTRPFTLVTMGTDHTVVTEGATDFGQSGIFFVVANLTAADEATLRNNVSIAAKMMALNITYRLKANVEGLEMGNGSIKVNLRANDIPAVNGKTLVGDRDINNPGYTAFTLSGAVTVGGEVKTSAQALDIWHIEQRLRYLGFGESSIAGSGEISVDGTLSKAEGVVLRQFDEIVDGKTEWDDGTTYTYEPIPHSRNLKKVAHAAPAYSVTSNELTWLNAYNAPHWVKIGDALVSGRGSLSDRWENVAGNTSLFGTSWVFDLMQLAPTQNNKLLFAGTGTLGSILNLGINTKYVSKKNQEHVDTRELLFGLDTNNGGITDALNKKLWNYANAETLAALLKNPTVAPNASDPLKNSQGINDQSLALGDFLAIFNATQNDGTAGHGGLSDHVGIIKSSTNPATQASILSILFGDGTQANGIINSAGLLLGATGANGGAIGSKLTAETLAVYMKTTPDAVRDWVGPINDAMRDFGIDTPSRVAAFLANVQVETGKLTKLIEGTGWRDPNLHTVGNFRALATNSATYLRYLGLGGEAQANYGYAGADGNGDEASGDGYKYRGRGLLQITHRWGYMRAQDGGRRGGDPSDTHGIQVPGLNDLYPDAHYDFVDNPDTIISDKTLAARIGAWYWRYGSAPAYGDLNAVVDRADKTEEENFRRTAAGVKGSVDQSRVDTWTALKTSLYDGNGYGNMSSVLGALGITATQAAGYESMFGITLNKREAVSIGGAGPAANQHQNASTNASVAAGSNSADTAIVSSAAVASVTTQMRDMAMQVTTETGIQSGSATHTETVPGAPALTSLVKTLTESVTSQQQISQAFKINEGDQYLRFTLSGIVLQNPGDMPEDAFEAALLNASTGGSLAGQANLSHTDAFLNLQGDGSTYVANGVTSILNPDGSRTYIVDLRGIQGGTEAILTFDLLGFGDAGSHVTISDVTTMGSPVAVDDLVEANQDTHAIVNVLDNDANTAGAKAVIVSAPTHGTLTALPDGSFEYTPDALWFGSDSFSYILDNGAVQSNIATVTLDVSHVNHAPVANDAIIETLEEHVAEGNVLAWTSDSDSDNLSVDVVNGPIHGTLTLNPDGSFSYRPDDLYRGEDSFSYRVSDGSLTSAVATVTIVMAPVNHLPTATDFAATVAEDGSILLDALAHATDVDGDALAAAIVDGPQHGSLIKGTDGKYTYRPDAYYAGNDSFTFTVNDGQGGSNIATVTLTVTPVNHAAVAINDTAATDQDKAVVIAVLANDSDIDNTTGINAGAPKPVNAGLIVRIVGQPANGSVIVNDDGTITYVPKAGYYGTDSFTYIANDGELDSAVASVTVTVRQVNHLPVAVDDSYNVVQGKTIVLNPLINDNDADGDSLTTVLVAGPQHGTLTRNADGTLTYVADAGFTGTDTLTYQASDGKSLSNVTTVRLTVSASNQAPVAVNDAVRAHNNQTVTIDVLANDRDADGDALTAAILNGPKHGSLTKNADGTFSYTADCLFTGTDTFTYVANDGKANSNTATVTITVLGPNLPPLAFDDVVDVKENGSIRIDPTANDWDINGDDLKALLVCGPSHGSLSLNTDGTYTYTPDANWYGLDGFTYQAYDGQYRSNPAMVWIRVAHVNQAPVAAADAFTVRAGQATRLEVLANDSDVDGDDITSKLSSSPKNGTLTRNRDGSFSYTAKSGFVGTDTFTYAATDGALDSKPVTVTITVLAPNHAPVAKDDKVTTNAGTSVRIDVLGNDTDSDGDPLSALLVCAPCHGKLTIDADGNYTYTPDKGWYGTDSFSYRATDGDAQSGVAMVSITVQKVNRAPTAQSASFQVQKDGSVRIDFDCLVDDPDGDALTLSLTNPAKGSLTRNHDGSYTYKPKSGFTGTDAFSYAVSDGKLSASATITLVVSKNPPCGNAMTILFGASASAGNAQAGGYIVVNLGSLNPPVIDWSASASTTVNDVMPGNWLDSVDLLSMQTGLMIRRD